jgi:hypothetical protein
VNGRRFSTAFLAVLAVVCAAGTVLTYGAAVALRDHGERAVATVLEVHDTGRDNRVLLRFRTRAGREVTTEAGNYYWDPKPRPGDRQEVLYDPADPAGNIADVRTGPNVFAVWAFGLGTVASAVAAYLTWTRRIDWSRG